MVGCGGGGIGIGGTGSSGTGGTGLVRVYPRLYNQPVNLNWAAYQDGTGAWQKIDPTSPGVYQFNVADANGRYGFAGVYVDGDGDVGVVILHLTRTDAAEVAIPMEATSVSPPEYSVEGQVQNARRPLLVQVNASGAQISSTSTSTYSVDGIPQGTWDVVAVEGDSGSPSPWLAIGRVYFLLNLMVTGDTRHNIDFNDPNKVRSIPDQRYTLTASPSPSSTKVVFVTVNGTQVLLSERNEYHPMPSELAGFYVVDTKWGDDREIRKVRAAPENFTLAPPAQLTGVTINFPRVTGLNYSGVQLWGLLFKGSDVVWWILTSPSWLRGSAEYTVPDFTSISGWNPNWSLPPNPSAQVSAGKTNKPLSAIFAPSTKWTEDYGPMVDGLDVEVATTSVVRSVMPSKSPKGSRRGFLWGSSKGLLRP